MFKQKMVRAIIVLLFILVFLAVYWIKNSLSSGEEIHKQQDGINIEVKLTEWEITPQNLTLGKGKTIHLTIVNRGSYPHDFVIPKLQLKTDTLAPGDQQTLTFVVNQPITIESYCSLPGHKESGMAANLSIK